LFNIIKKYRAQISAALLVLIIGSGFMFFQEDMESLLSLIKSDRTHPAILILSLLILPVMFFPFSALLILIGVRFDAFSGILIMFMLIPMHLVFSFFMVRLIFHAHMERFAKKKNYRIFNIPRNRYLEFGIVFMAVPGLPYTVKNYLLPISGIPFREYFLIGWLVQGVMGIPFVVLGDAASKWNIYLFLIFILLFLIVYFITRQIRKRCGRMVESLSDH
jgi:uncharacterized membrane protein YdjX (TVP38/TMEM64 family)